jgi:glycine dehydrogenase subunit 1
MRYLPLTDSDRAAMLKAVGAASIEELYRDVPRSARLTGPLDLPDHAGEIEVERALAAFAARNVPAGSVPSFLGAGAYRHHVPATVDYLIQRGEFLTAYTPYQPEVSQGTLQTLYEFQTYVAMIAGMEVANASMYDGATAAAEAVMMAHRVTGRRKAVLSGALHPHYREVTAATARFLDTDVFLLPADPAAAEDLSARIDADTACVVVQYPDFFGRIADLAPLARACHAAGALLVVAVTEIVALGLIRPPGETGADIVVGEGASLGNALSFGGPYVGLFATREKYMRQMPGRLAGETVDVDGRRGYVLTLATREQHIRREKATSNICTNSQLCALAFAIHLALLGDTGFRRLAEINHAHAVMLAERLARVRGAAVANATFFNEFTLRLPKPAGPIADTLADRGVLAGVPVSRFYPGEASCANLLLVAATETNTEADIERLAAALEAVL